MFAAVTILLAVSVYQIIVTDKLPSSSDTVPVIGQLLKQLNIHFLPLNCYFSEHTSHIAYKQNTVKHIKCDIFIERNFSNNASTWKIAFKFADMVPLITKFHADKQ